jgi:hypothetical protein
MKHPHLRSGPCIYAPKENQRRIIIFGSNLHGFRQDRAPEASLQNSFNITNAE